jgi:hypothetical protein
VIVSCLAEATLLFEPVEPVGHGFTANSAAAGDDQVPSRAILKVPTCED